MVTLRVLTGRDEVAQAQDRLMRALDAESIRLAELAFGYQGGGTKAKVLWSEKHGFWLAHREAKNRYWNAFGLGDPRRKEDTDIVVEMNPPFEGINRRMAGALLRDDGGGLYLAHRGRLGGGRAGIGQAAFLKHYRGEFTTVQDGERDSRVVVVACITGSAFAEEVAAFIRKVKCIKDTVVGGSPVVAARKHRRAAATGESAPTGLSRDTARAKEIAARLHAAYLPAGSGIFGVRKMPEAKIPEGMERGSITHILFVTLTVTIDYQRDAAALWRAARKTIEDPETRWLFSTERLAAAEKDEVEAAMRRHKLSKKHSRDAGFWKTVATIFHDKWKGDPRLFLTDCDHHAPTVLARLKSDWHRVDGKKRVDFPYLRGAKIGPLWVRMLRDYLGVSFTGLEEVPIPVDVHILRATLATGVLHGTYSGPVEPVYREVREIWREATEGLERPDGQPLVPIDVDAALWNLSRKGCGPTRQGRENTRECLDNCPAGKGRCVEGELWMDASHIELAT